MKPTIILFSGLVLLFLLITRTSFSPLWLNQFFPNQYLQQTVVAQTLADFGVAKMIANEQYQSTGSWPESTPDYVTSRFSEIYFVQPNIIEAVFIDKEEVPSQLVNKKIRLLMNLNNFTWQCESGEFGLPAGALPPHMGCKNKEQTTISSTYNTILISLVIGLPIIFLLYVLNNPIIKPIQKNPEKIKDLPLSILPKVDQLLNWSFKRNATLIAANITNENWHLCKTFTQRSPQEQSSQLAERFRALSQASDGWRISGSVFKWVFGENSSIGLDGCLVLIPHPNGRVQSLVEELITTFHGDEVVLIIEQDETKNSKLRHLANNKNNRFVLPYTREITRWLLDRNPTPYLLRLLREQLFATRISPYQTRGGIINASQFFGRDSELSIILDRKMTNYVLIGGRQLGKTSLLKRVESLFKNNPEIQCFYLSLRDHRLPERLNDVCETKKGAVLSETIMELNQRFPGKKILVLVDEADLFIRHERQNDYTTLNEIRSLGDEGLCHFMFTGFWELYASVILDYQSPLRNFGEVIKVGGLSHEACIAMAEHPMATLGISYASENLSTKLANSVGHRANLMAIACQFCLLALKDGGNEITKEIGNYSAK